MSLEVINLPGFYGFPVPATKLFCVKEFYQCDSPAVTQHKVADLFIFFITTSH